MKVVVFKGGIGNQLFQYSLYLKKKQQGHKVYYINGARNSHNGLEITKYFENELIELPIWLSNLFFFLKQNLHILIKPIISHDNNYKEWKVFFDGYWQDQKYMPISFTPKFHLKFFSDKNYKLIDEIRKVNSISIHVRRGDYMKSENVKRFADICTPDYYNRAIEIVKNQIGVFHLFVFSDDIPWCKENLKLSNISYVDWNVGNDSIYDMYLMSLCKGSIIANSSFSYWGAQLGEEKRIVIYPKKWFNDIDAPNIFPISWIGI